MATQSRNKVVPKDDQKEFVLNCIKEDGGLILSKEIGKMAQEKFGLSHPMSESKITTIVNSLRLEDRHWQIHGSKKGYKWSESDVEYQTWKSEYQSKIETMIRCLHKVECSYIKDVNVGTSKLGKNFIPNLISCLVTSNGRRFRLLRKGSRSQYLSLSLALRLKRSPMGVKTIKVSLWTWLRKFAMMASLGETRCVVLLRSIN